MSIIRDLSTFIWLLLFYIFADYASVNLDMPALHMTHVLWAQDERFYLTTRDAFVIAGMFLLFIEIYKAATSGVYSVSETIISFITSVVYLTLFLLWDKAHSIEFFMLMLMSFVDSIGGFVISNNTARRDISIG